MEDTRGQLTRTPETSPRWGTPSTAEEDRSARSTYQCRMSSKSWTILYSLLTVHFFSRSHMMKYEEGVIPMSSEQDDR